MDYINLALRANVRLFVLSFSTRMSDKQNATYLVKRMIPSTQFYTVHVLEEFGVLMGICGRNKHIRMYNLEMLENPQAFTKKQRKEPFIKIRETKGSSDYTLSIPPF